MLYSSYSKNEKNIVTLEPVLGNLRMAVLAHLRSSRWYNQLEGILPENWEEDYDLVLYSDPVDVLNAFKEQKYHRYSTLIAENQILSFLASKKEDTKPGRYFEYTKRDNDFPYEENEWAVNNDLTEFVKPVFHVDHRLIWITGSREINFFSTEDIKKIPFKYTIHVYTPDVDVLTKVQYMKSINIE